MKLISSFVLVVLLAGFLFGQHTVTAQIGSDVPFFIATCQDGRQVIGHRIILENLPLGKSVRLTAIAGDNFDPTIANLTGQNRDSAPCATNSPEVVGSTVAVPSVGRIDANTFSAQISIAPDASGRIEFIVGGFAGQSGQYALVIENLSISAAGETDTIRVQIPPSTYQEWVGVFMIGDSDGLDPFLTSYAGEVGTPVLQQCDNAGTQSCPPSPKLNDRGAILSTEPHVGDDFDAGLMDTYDQAELTFAFRDASGTGTGNYIAVITGTAPGAVASRSYICDTIPIELRDSSPSYNPAYPLENILDGDPDTFWVTGAAPLNAEGVREENAYVLIGVLEDRPINRIRINGYAQDQTSIEQNSLKKFALRFPNATGGDLVTALEAELALHAGVQTFSILPTRVDEFGLILIDNYGGTLYVLVDIEICGLS